MHRDLVPTMEITTAILDILPIRLAVPAMVATATNASILPDGMTVTVPTMIVIGTYSSTLTACGNNL